MVDSSSSAGQFEVGTRVAHRSEHADDERARLDGHRILSTQIDGEPEQLVVTRSCLTTRNKQRPGDGRQHQNGEAPPTRTARIGHLGSLALPDSRPQTATISSAIQRPLSRVTSFEQIALTSARSNKRIPRATRQANVSTRWMVGKVSLPLINLPASLPHLRQPVACRDLRSGAARSPHAAPFFFRSRLPCATEGVSAFGAGALARDLSRRRQRQE